MALPEQLKKAVDRMSPSRRARVDSEAALIGMTFDEFVVMRVRALRRLTLFGISFEDFMYLAREHNRGKGGHDAQRGDTATEAKS